MTVCSAWPHVDAATSYLLHAQGYELAVEKAVEFLQENICWEITDVRGG